jgi:hypothetical protein
MEGVMFGNKSHIKYDSLSVKSITPGLSSSWWGIAGALFSLDIIRSRRGGWIGDGEALVALG